MRCNHGGDAGDRNLRLYCIVNFNMRAEGYVKVAFDILCTVHNMRRGSSELIPSRL